MRWECLVSDRNSQRRRARFNLGNDVAESDPLLSQAFYASSTYEAVRSRDLPHCLFLIGRTGSGKSALLNQLEEDERGHVVRIIPENLSLEYITNLDVLEKLRQAHIVPDPFFVALWKHVLLVELIQHRHRSATEKDKRNIIDTLKLKAKNDKRKKALEYLQESAHNFWCQTDERVRELVDQVSTEVSGQLAASTPALGPAVSASAGYKKGRTTSDKTETAQRYSAVLNTAQVPKLNELLVMLDEDVLESDQHFTFVIIDDLDKEWLDLESARTAIRCLLRALWDMQKLKHVKVVVALRTNIFASLNIGRTETGQEEKYRALSVDMSWNRYELEQMADKRARVASVQHGGTGKVTSIRQLLPNKSKKRPDAFQYILDRTLLRPRDLIAFLNECYKRTNGQKLSWANIIEAEPEYSRGRRLALRDEWKTTYPGIDEVIDVFHGGSAEFDRDEVSEKLLEVGLLLEKRDFPGVEWLTGRCYGMWSGLSVSWLDQYQPLLRLLFDIGFLGMKSSSGHVFYAPEEPNYADSDAHVEGCILFSIHPMYRMGLDVTIADAPAVGSF